jgi:membrane-associated protease RseP (regulator of RpoE activity)
MPRLILGFLFTCSLNAFAGMDADLHGVPDKRIDRKGNWTGGSDAITGDEMQKRLMDVNGYKKKTGLAETQRKMEESVEGREAVLTPVVVKPDNSMENPADVLSRYNNAKRDGSGALKEENPYVARCVPNFTKGRSPASVRGFKCTDIQAGTGLAKAGLMENDIILSVDGKKVNTPQAASKFIKKIEIAEYDKIVILRDGREEILAAPLR